MKAWKMRPVSLRPDASFDRGACPQADAAVDNGEGLENEEGNGRYLVVGEGFQVREDIRLERVHLLCAERAWDPRRL